MFAFIAALVFFTAAVMALSVIGLMLAAYRDKMVAALLFAPIPAEPPVYRLQIKRPRAPATQRFVVAPARPLAA